MLEFDIDDKQFVTPGNGHGVSAGDTALEYHVDGQWVTGSYEGGRSSYVELTPSRSGCVF